MSAASIFPSADVEQEFHALRGKLVDVSRQLGVARQTLQLKLQTKRRSDAYKAELGKVPATTPAYKGVGRMFIRSSIPEAQGELEQRATAAASEVAALQRSIDALEKTFESDEKSIKELVEKHAPPKK